MILYQWRGPVRNFGDELNGLIWPRLLPDYFDDDPAARFLGIGSILDQRHDPAAIKWVAGSGYGGYEAPIALDATWRIHWVRGPRTAAVLGLPLSLGMGDPASLLPLTGLSPLVKPSTVGFMPHFESNSRGAWAEAASAASVTLIDPSGDPRAILDAIGACRVLISEALHGVIVADALRIPWIAIQPLMPIHRPKWADWADALDLDLNARPLRPSTALERAWRSPLSRFHAGREMLEQRAHPLRCLGRAGHIERAAGALRAAAAADPMLSRDSALDRSQTRMMTAIEAIRRGPALPSSPPARTVLAARGAA